MKSANISQFFSAGPPSLLRSIRRDATGWDHYNKHWLCDRSPTGQLARLHNTTDQVRPTFTSCQTYLFSAKLDQLALEPS